jgi:glucose-6-phosphate isomerase
VLTKCFIARKPLAIVYGWDIARELLDGAHDLDTHFVTAHARSNIPVLLALSDVWNDAFMGASSRVVTPFAAAFASYPSFVASLEAQACTRPIGTADAPPSCPSLVVDGGTRGAVDRALYQSGQVLSSELVATFDGQVAFNAQMEMQTGNSGGSSNFLDSAIASQDALLCSLFAHADELALGNRTNGDRDSASDVRSVASSPVNLDEVPEDGSDGNRPSLLLLTGKVDAFVCGQLVALAEHRAAVKAHIWGLDPFAARRCGASLRLNRTDQLKESFRAIRQGASDEEDDDGAGGPENRLILSTKTLLRHYSNFTRDLR